MFMELLTGQKRRVELCREHQLADSTLEGWVQQVRDREPEVFEQNGQSASEAGRIAELERVIGRLTVELETAKKASSWLNSR
jgi:transposase-like protein